MEGGARSEGTTRNDDGKVGGYGEIALEEAMQGGARSAGTMGNDELRWAGDAEIAWEEAIEAGGIDEERRAAVHGRRLQKNRGVAVDCIK